MNKLFTSFLILLGISTAASAQTSGNFEFGVNAGLNMSYVIDGFSTAQSNSTVGFNAGISGDYYFSDRWSIKVKAIYDQKGWGDGFFDVTTNDGNTTTYEGVNYKLNYLTIPVMANWHFTRQRNWYLNFGPYAGFLLNATTSGNPDVSNTNLKSYFNSTDFGLAFGVGVKIPVSDNMKFFIEAEGQSGFSNLVTNSGDSSTLQNARSSLNIGLIF